MNPARLAFLLVGMALILLARLVAYFQTDLRNTIPAGVAVAILLLVAGVFVLLLSNEIRRTRTRSIERETVYR